MRALDLAQRRGAQYADVRVVNHRDESISAYSVEPCNLRYS